MSTPPYRVIPSTMAAPSTIALARTYQVVEDAVADMGTGIVIDTHASLVAFHESHDQRLIEHYVNKTSPVANGPGTGTVSNQSP